MIWKLEHDGTLTSIGEVTSLLTTAKKYLITDPAWNLLDFATDMNALSGKNLKFYMAPILGFATIGGQDVNQVDIPTIQAAIKAKFDPPPAVKPASSAKSTAKAAPVPAASTVTADVYNGGTTGGLADLVMSALVAKGYVQGVTTNATAQSETATSGTQVFYGKGASANAAKIADYFGATAKAALVADRRACRGAARHGGDHCSGRARARVLSRRRRRRRPARPGAARRGTTSRPAARSRSRPRRSSAFRACTESSLIVTLLL